MIPLTIPTAIYDLFKQTAYHHSCGKWLLVGDT
jgi:hypothetical protein